MGKFIRRIVMKQFDFVSESEYLPVKRMLEDILEDVKTYLKREHDLSFDYHLIGSAGRELITREIGGNKGFDFDYNLIIPTLYQGEKYYPKVVKEIFLEAFNYAVDGTRFDPPENSTSIITIKCKDRKRSRIKYSCDFAISYYVDKYNHNKGMMFLKNYKDGRYGFNLRGSTVDYDAKLNRILRYRNGWEIIEDEYIKLKNNNKQNKKSFVLYYEAINNVYNQMRQYENS